jgi:alpha-tubulin suppressor-like RCC1 family protein
MRRMRGLGRATGGVAVLIGSAGLALVIPAQGAVASGAGSGSGQLAWGAGAQGELGNGSTSAALTPTAVSLPTGVTATAISASYETAFAIGSNGTLYSWGYGPFGQLGNGTTTSVQTTPVVVSLPSGVTPTAVDPGNYTGYAIGSDGILYAWGNGGEGELGNGTTTSSPTPVAVSLPNGVTPTAAAGGSLTAYAIGSDGNLYAWGHGSAGALGNGTTTSTQDTPVSVSLPSGVSPVAVTSGLDTGYAIGSDGNLYAWGDGTDGALGNGTTPATQSTPVVVSLPNGVTPMAIAAGDHTGYALGSNGTLYAWGSGTVGELGNGTTTSTQSTPLAVPLPAGVAATAIAAAGQTAYAYGTDGALYGWGSGSAGQLGNGTSSDSSTPGKVSLPPGFVATGIAAGLWDGYAIGSSPPPTITGFTPASGRHGSKVTITGTNLAGAKKVSIGTVAAKIVSDSATTIQIKVPATAHTGKIKVVTPNGKAKSATSFTVT